MTTIDLTVAVKTAKEKIQGLYSDEKLNGLALEEIELIEEDNLKLWSVTLGFHRQKAVSALSTGMGALASIYPQTTQIEHRVYKTIVINAETGDFVRMNMRQV